MKKRTENYLVGFSENVKNALTLSTEIIVNAYFSDKMVLTCGNGGSACDAEHISGELLKSFMLKRKVDANFKKALTSRFADGNVLADNLQGGIKCLAISSLTALNTAFSNDCNAEFAFAQGVNALGRKGDVFIAISTSGNSKNVLHAVKTAIAKEMMVIGFTGNNGGALKELCDVCFLANETETYKVQEEHIKFYHALCLMVESEIFEE